jgi:gentisate 1,2-dioxygenase
MNRDQLSTRRDAFHQRLRSLHLREGYSYDDDGNFVSRPYWPQEPKNRVRPHLWRWREVRELALAAGDMVGLGKGLSQYDRRVLALTNPGLDGEYSLSGTLFGDIQLIRPGEAAPCHRHTPCAARFILEGTGGWTTVAGDRVHVQPKDIVFTGQFPWHDHGNDGPGDFIFLDVLDIPLMYFMGTSHWEFDHERATGSVDVVNQPAQVTDFPNAAYAGGRLAPRFRPSWTRDPRDFAHLSWADAREGLERLRHERGSAHDGIILELESTAGGPIGPTMSLFVQLLRDGEKTAAHRHTTSTIYVAAEGKGSVLIEDQRFAFEPGDIFVVPSWYWHSFEALPGSDVVLQSVSDASLVTKLNLWREQKKDAEGRVVDTGWGSEIYR